MDNGSAGVAEAQLHEEKINLRHYWHVILERRWLVVAAFCCVFALCLIYLFKATRIFQATARMQIDRESENVLNIKDAFAVDGLSRIISKRSTRTSRAARSSSRLRRSSNWIKILAMPSRAIPSRR